MQWCNCNESCRRATSPWSVSMAMLLSPRGPAPVSLVVGHTYPGGSWHFSYFVLLFNPLHFSSFTPLIAKQVWYHSPGPASRCWRTLAKPFLLPKSPDRPLVSPLLRYQPHDWSPPKSEHHVNNLSFPFPHQNLSRNKQQNQQQSQKHFLSTYFSNSSSLTGNGDLDRVA